MRPLTFTLILPLCVAAMSAARWREANAPTGATFVAIIVPNAEKTAGWYQAKLGFHITNRSTAPSGVARNVTVESGYGMIEIIEHAQSIPLEPLIPDPAQRRLVRGISKVGFFVQDLDTLEKTLKGRAVDIVSPTFRDRDLRLESFIIRDGDGNYVQFLQRTSR
jgi:catechol 2,3-dioxygenase-like lactoylglutathione lyase family enzyme